MYIVHSQGLHESGNERIYIDNAPSIFTNVNNWNEIAVELNWAKTVM